MASRYQASTTVHGPAPAVLTALIQVLAECGLTIAAVDPVQGVVFANRRRGGMRARGHVTVEVGRRTGGEVTEVQLTSAGLVGWLYPGRDRRTVQAVVTALRARPELQAPPG